MGHDLTNLHRQRLHLRIAVQWEQRHLQVRGPSDVQLAVARADWAAASCDAQLHANLQDPFLDASVEEEEEEEGLGVGGEVDDEVDDDEEFVDAVQDIVGALYDGERDDDADAAWGSAVPREAFDASEDGGSSAGDAEPIGGASRRGWSPESNVLAGSSSGEEDQPVRPTDGSSAGSQGQVALTSIRWLQDKLMEDTVVLPSPSMDLLRAIGGKLSVRARALALWPSQSSWSVNAWQTGKPPCLGHAAIVVAVTPGSKAALTPTYSARHT
ncbi:hypothetical protein K523DRAFT_359091 [Schizophyllum commune Tattone D]|nr:hypothetical protein K523DRAFT_359091 [Schizophyllum commune Tattone D]